MTYNDAFQLDSLALGINTLAVTPDRKLPVAIKGGADH
jgi:hypothetical protein